MLSLENVCLVCTAPKSTMWILLLQSNGTPISGLWFESTFSCCRVRNYDRCRNLNINIPHSVFFRIYGVSHMVQHKIDVFACECILEPVTLPGVQPSIIVITVYGEPYLSFVNTVQWCSLWKYAPVFCPARNIISHTVHRRIGRVSHLIPEYSLILSLKKLISRLCPLQEHYFPICSSHDLWDLVSVSVNKV